MIPVATVMTVHVTVLEIFSECQKLLVIEVGYVGVYIHN